MPLPCNKPRKSPGTDHPVPGRLSMFHIMRARRAATGRSSPSRPQGNQQDANSRVCSPKSRPQDNQHCCPAPGLRPPKKPSAGLQSYPPALPAGRVVFRSAKNIPYTRERPGGALARRPVSECKKSPEWRQPFRGARQRISTCRPCRRRQREPQARERECPPPGIRWSAPSQPRRRRSAAQNGSPWWDR